ncbi:cytochrome ubiquinol oxidase subunit I [Klebsiella pneumoniae]|uniref:Cytochrome ubiquinol oxidase subunit I n=1 Tax=Klebsiella pneumoniae TaxID=573 RepID=A0A939NRA3_KLEPN|nr:cytochrome ubiquinol oxidase subunit I [Klebsiella pneumoniae]
MPALKDFPKEDRPYSPAVFWSFRIMVGMGVLMIALGSAAPGCAIGAATTTSFQWFALCMGPPVLLPRSPGG